MSARPKTPPPPPAFKENQEVRIIRDVQCGKHFPVGARVKITKRRSAKSPGHGEITSQDGQYKLGVMVMEEVETVGDEIRTGHIPHDHLSLTRNGPAETTVIAIRARVFVTKEWSYPLQGNTLTVAKGTVVEISRPRTGNNVMPKKTKDAYYVIKVVTKEKVAVPKETDMYIHHKALEAL